MHLTCACVSSPIPPHRYLAVGAFSFPATEDRSLNESADAFCQSRSRGNRVKKPTPSCMEYEAIAFDPDAPMNRRIQVVKSMLRLDRLRRDLETASHEEAQPQKRTTPMKHAAKTFKHLKLRPESIHTPSDRLSVEVDCADGGQSVHRINVGRRSFEYDNLPDMADDLHDLLALTEPELRAA